MRRQIFLPIAAFSLLLAEAVCYRFMGCYKDFSNEVRLMIGDQKNFKGTLTPVKCINHCKTNGFAYAGVEYGFQCFCSNERPSFNRFSDLPECNTKCEGDRSKICGGNQRLSVFDIHNKRVNYVQANYMGCYADDGNRRRALRDRVSPDRAEMTPEFCLGYCYNYGYRYAGVQYRNQCYCGDDIKGEQTTEEECDLDCAGDPRLLCGGTWKSNIYHTSITNESEDGRLIGCFKDSRDLRLLSGQALYLSETNSPRRCLNICLQLGFKYAGVEYGNECHCGNKRPDERKETAESECLSQCPKSKLRACGGTWRIAVYSTDPPAVHSAAPLPQKPTFIIVPAIGNQVASQDTNSTKSVGTLISLIQPENRILPLVPKTTSRPTVKQTTGSTTERWFRKESVEPLGGPKVCIQSETKHQQRSICKGELIFQEKFDSLSPTLWKHDIFMPDAPDYEFVVFEDNRTNVFISNGMLHIKPSVFSDEFVRRGRLHLEKCTRESRIEECKREGKAYTLLPPVRSARINTKETFSFKYGKVVVNAKLPAGDWIIPEIWLEPKERFYGADYLSGRINIAYSRGNRNLDCNGEDMGSRVLEQGVWLGTNNKIRDLKVRKPNRRNKGWYEDFHNFTLIWTPDNLSFQVDDEQIDDLIQPHSGKLFHLAGFDRTSARIWEHGSLLAPFDQKFYISVGVSVGGMRDFPDSCVTSGGKRKPWTNKAVKGLLDFWDDRANWLPTWRDNEKELIISEIAVYALE